MALDDPEYKRSSDTLVFDDDDVIFSFKRELNNMQIRKCGRQDGQ